MASTESGENKTISALALSLNAPAVKRLKTSETREAATLLISDNKTRKNKSLKPGKT